MPRGTQAIFTYNWHLWPSPHAAIVSAIWPPILHTTGIYGLLMLQWSLRHPAVYHYLQVTFIYSSLYENILELEKSGLTLKLLACAIL